MRKIYLFLIFISLCGAGLAQTVTLQEAAAAAQRYFEQNGKTLTNCAKIIQDDQKSPLLYFFNAENGFVVISGDKSAPPVLSFSDQQLYNDSDVVPPFEMWINHYADQIRQIKKQHIVQSQFVSQWEAVLSGAPVFRSGDEVEPLMLSKWDQGEYYNYYCPKDAAGDNGRVVTGCVATALAQLIYYYRFPETGTGSYSYTDENYGVQSADYGNTTYNYNAMCDVPTSINTEISKLIYHCGVGVDMVYGPDGSGMYNHSAARVLRTYFKFSPETEYLYRDSTDLNWDSVIVSHLNRKMPMYYAGWSLPNINGHGFICDGYKTVDSCYFFHFNFGWSGYMDNYYYTDALVVGGSNFNLAQELIINAYPDTTQYTYPTPQPLTGSLTLTAMEGTFTDGSLAHEHCPAGMDFLWNIEPDVSNLTNVTLTLHYSLAEGDTLFVTNPYVNTFEMRTADAGTVTIDWGTTDLTVNLLTHSSASEGFRAHYTANRTVFCSGTKVFSSISGHIEDGSGDHEYNNLTTCKYKIVLGPYSAIHVDINSLDLEENKDFLYFYDNQMSEANHLLTLTGNISNTGYTFETRRLLMVLETDETGSAGGFSLDYEGGQVGVEELSRQEVSMYPNPAKDQLRIVHSTPIRQVDIFNAEGEFIFSETPDTEEASLQISQLPAGIYIVRITSGNQIITRKFVKL
ncbi:MAG: C10 family peptidase [Bacteroidales bacterium]|nr:C10 family peptidase [Bacteroidales bacterium]